MFTPDWFRSMAWSIKPVRCKHKLIKWWRKYKWFNSRMKNHILAYSHRTLSMSYMYIVYICILYIYMYNFWVNKKRETRVIVTVQITFFNSNACPQFKKKTSSYLASQFLPWFSFDSQFPLGVCLSYVWVISVQKCKNIYSFLKRCKSFLA